MKVLTFGLSLALLVREVQSSHHSSAKGDTCFATRALIPMAPQGIISGDQFSGNNFGSGFQWTPTRAILRETFAV